MTRSSQTRSSRRFLLPTLAVLLGLAGAGCRTGKLARPADGRDARLVRIEALLDTGRTSDALLACVDLSRQAPELPGLPAVQARIARRLNDERAEALRRREPESRRAAVLDLERHNLLPDTYGVTRPVTGETAALRSPPSAMESVLTKPVSLHLEGVTLSAFILALGQSENINIVADGEDNGKTMTIHADKVPLREILDYIARNLGVTFYAGENVIWVTAQAPAADARVPMETRLYRLRRGLSGTDLDDPAAEPEIEATIRRFVPVVEGGDLVFNRKSHTLIARNTRDNLARIEDLIEALDVYPPQVLIEARFVGTGVTDLRELGLDWALNSPLSVTRDEVLRYGRPASANSTEVASGATLGFLPFSSAGQGLNLTYQGVLTDPLFKAVLHALQIAGKSRTLSVPRVTAANNREATIRVGEDFRYFEEFDVESVPSTTDDGQTIYRTALVPRGSPKLQELGIELKVTPSVGADAQAIALRLAPSIKSFDRYVTYETAAENNNNNNNANAATNQTAFVKLPIFKTSEVQTEVFVRSGETVVLGGLVTSSEQTRKEGIPLLSSIPLIGRLFRHDNIEERKENLLIFVTATLISDRGENLVAVGPATARTDMEAAEAPAPEQMP